MNGGRVGCSPFVASKKQGGIIGDVFLCSGGFGNTGHGFVLWEQLGCKCYCWDIEIFKTLGSVLYGVNVDGEQMKIMFAKRQTSNDKRRGRYFKENKRHKGNLKPCQRGIQGSCHVFCAAVVPVTPLPTNASNEPLPTSTKLCTGDWCQNG